MTNNLQKKIKDWGDSFYLPNLCRLSENGYENMFGHLNADIPYYLFHRNVLIAMERAERVTERAKQ
jgi:hypothetical protein